jgi:hypothetical protein
VSRAVHAGALRVVAVATVLLGMLSVAGPAAGDATWRLEQPPPPAGARFKVPLGAPGDLECWAANACLMSVEGNATVPSGLLFYDGVSWHQYTTVCGGPSDTSRIAWAGPDEFWTVSTPSFPRTGSGLGLCHFKNGAVVGSFSTPLQSSDPFFAMDSAGCNGPTDCWFGGVAAQDPSGVRQGSFHLHWDGNGLTSVYGPQGRGVSDVQYFQGTWYESMLIGAVRENRTNPIFLASPEPYGPVLIHQIGPDGQWDDANFVAHPMPGVPPDGTELLTADASSTDLWFGGGGAASGPDAPPDGSFPRPPIAVHLTGIFLEELPLDPSQFGSSDRLVDIAAVPGTSDAWAADQPFADRASSSAHAKVVLLHADGSSQLFTLPAAGGGRGSAARIACTSASNCWMATSAGWVFHYTDGTQQPQNTDPNFQGTITFRPNEAAAQFVPDTPPPDDSQLNAPAPPPQPITPTQGKAKKLPPLLKNVHRLKLVREGKTSAYILTLTFTVVRRGKVQLQAYRHGTLVAETKLTPFRPGHRALHLVLHTNAWPSRLAFVVVEKGVSGGGGSSGGGGGSNTISTAPDTGAGGTQGPGIR